jgi:hypothetical protein
MVSIWGYTFQTGGLINKRYQNRMQEGVKASQFTGREDVALK